MRVRTFMRVLRADRFSLGDCSRITGIAKGELSMFERGHSFPYDAQADKLEPFYGPRSGWYPAGVAAILFDDLADCDGCGEELDPDLRRGVRYHGAACRAEHRRNGHADVEPLAHVRVAS